MHFRLVMLGFGNVGKELAKLLLRKREELQQRYDITYSVTGIATAKHGVAVDLNGLDLAQALEVPDLSGLSVHQFKGNVFEFMRQSEGDILFENTPVNYDTGQPAVDHLSTALKMGMHGITANKGPVVHAYRSLKQVATENGVHFYFESTVMDGAPIFSLFRESLPGANLRSLRGILNSTTNMILTLMERGESFEQAVAYCQSIGIAETDPSGDIDGWDAAVKVAALATVLMDIPLKPQQVARKGIRDLTAQDITGAMKDGKRWKLVCSAHKEGGTVRAQVGPELVERSSPLFAVDGTTSVVQFETDVLGALSVIEADPGPHTTAYGLYADFLNATRKK